MRRKVERFVHRETENGIAILTFCRPEAGNAFPIEGFQQVTEELEQCSREEGVRVVLLTGSGKHFSVGGDIREMRTHGYISCENARATGRMSGAAKRCAKPVVAVINGTAAGAGCGLALACDFRIMAPSSALATGFIHLGLSGDTGCLYHLTYLVGLGKAMELMMLGTILKGEKAAQFGLATEIVSEENLLEAGRRFAVRLANMPAEGLALQKKLIYQHFYRDYEEYCELEARLFDRAGHTADHLEAVAAFLEKRRPVFGGTSHSTMS